MGNRDFSCFSSVLETKIASPISLKNLIWHAGFKKSTKTPGTRSPIRNWCTQLSMPVSCFSARATNPRYQEIWNRFSSRKVTAIRNFVIFQKCTILLTRFLRFPLVCSSQPQLPAQIFNFLWQFTLILFGRFYWSREYSLGKLLSDQLTVSRQRFGRPSVINSPKLWRVRFSYWLQMRFR